jgi:membrane fusion protein (multidrug efflux system)
MKKLRWKYLVVPVGLLVGAIMVFRSGAYAEDQTQAAAENVISVRVAAVQYIDSTPGLPFNGSLEGQTSVTISPKISGRIAEVPVQEGQQVKAGDPLIRLEAVELSNSARQAGEAVRKAQITYDMAKNNYARYQSLYDKGAISAQQLEDARGKFQIAEADLSSAAASQGNAEQQLANTVITAPEIGRASCRERV